MQSKFTLPGAHESFVYAQKSLKKALNADTDTGYWKLAHNYQSDSKNLGKLFASKLFADVFGDGIEIVHNHNFEKHRLQLLCHTDDMKYVVFLVLNETGDVERAIMVDCEEGIIGDAGYIVHRGKQFPRPNWHGVHPRVRRAIRIATGNFCPLYLRHVYGGY